MLTLDINTVSVMQFVGGTKEPGTMDYGKNRIFDALENSKNVWKELTGLGLLPRAR